MRLPASCSFLRKAWSALMSFSISWVGLSDSRRNNAARSSADVLTSSRPIWPRDNSRIFRLTPTSDDFSILSKALSAVVMFMIAAPYGLVAQEEYVPAEVTTFEANHLD